MKKLILFLFLFGILIQPVFSAEVCSTIDSSGWTQDQLNHREGMAYALAVEAGQNIRPSKVTDSKICFESPAFNVSSVITSSVMLDRINQIYNNEAARQADLNSKLAEIALIESQIPLDDNDWSSLNSSDRDKVSKNMLRAERLRKETE